MRKRVSWILGIAAGVLALAVVPNWVGAATPLPILTEEYELQGEDYDAAATEIGLPEPELKQQTRGRGHWVNGPRKCQKEPYTLTGEKANCSIIVIGSPGRSYHVVSYDPELRRYRVTKLQ